MAKDSRPPSYSTPRSSTEDMGFRKPERPVPMAGTEGMETVKGRAKKEAMKKALEAASKIPTETRTTWDSRKRQSTDHENP